MKQPSPLPRPAASARRLILLLAFVLAGGAAGCASSSDIKKVDETNRVQDERLKALEQDIATTLNQQRDTLQSLQTEVRALNGRVQLVNERTERMASETSALNKNQERGRAGQLKVQRMVEQEASQMKRFRLDAENDLDKMRVQLGQLEQLLRSPIASLPDETKADKHFRQAYFLLINGELDLATKSFTEFREAYPKDKRVVESFYRQGQALFLLRKYDHASIPFFEVVEKSPKHKLAVPSRWMLARALEETGELKLAREFYGQLITGKTRYAADATRRMAFLDRLFPPNGASQKK